MSTEPKITPKAGERLIALSEEEVSHLIYALGFVGGILMERRDVRCTEILRKNYGVAGKLGVTAALGVPSEGLIKEKL